MRRLWAIFALAVASILALTLLGCGASSTPAATNSPAPPAANPMPSPAPPPPPPPPPPSPATTPSKFIYGVIGFEPEGNGPQAGQIDSSSGKISLVSGSPFDSGLGQSDVVQVLADPKGRFLYSLHQQASVGGMPLGESGISEQKIDSQTGALTANPPLVFSSAQDAPLAIDGLSRFLYHANPAGFVTYAIDQNTGALTQASTSGTTIPRGTLCLTHNVASLCIFLASSPDGKFLFSAGDGSIETLSINQQTGELTAVPGAVMPTRGSSGPLAIEADGKFLYAGNAAEGTVAVFAVASSGMLTPVAGSPFKGETSAEFLALTPNGQFLYAVSDMTNVVEGFRVNPKSGTFTSIGFSPISGTALALDGSGKFAYIASAGLGTSPNFLGTFAIDPASGALTQVSSAPGPVIDNADDLVTVP